MWKTQHLSYTESSLKTLLYDNKEYFLWALTSFVSLLSLCSSKSGFFLFPSYSLVDGNFPLVISLNLSLFRAYNKIICLTLPFFFAPVMERPSYWTLEIPLFLASSDISLQSCHGLQDPLLQIKSWTVALSCISAITTCKKILPEVTMHLVL